MMKAAISAAENDFFREENNTQPTLTQNSISYWKMKFLE